MRFFDYDNNEEYQNDIDRFLSEGGEITIDDLGLVDKLFPSDEPQQLLVLAVKISEKAIWWRFASTKRKMQAVQTVYQWLLEISAKEQ